jgi:ABC-type phosphate transport system substrate-binding protein
MRKLTLLGLTFGIALLVPLGSVFAESHAAYVVIVNPNNPLTTLDRKFLEEAFLKKATRWPSDTVIRPVDLVSSSPVRRQFTEDVLKRPVEAVKGYWQQRIFSGRDVPPPELDTDGEVVKYVLQYEAAIGYVSGGADLGGAKVIAVE